MNPKAPNPRCRHDLGRSARRGFSLIEILVVITIIVGLLSVAAKMMGGGGNAGQATRTSSLQLKAMVELAQAQAVGTGNRTAILIYNKFDDSGANERYLRFVQLVERQRDGNTTPETYLWRAIGNGSYLARGTFYWPEGFASNPGYAVNFAPTDPVELGKALDGATWIGLEFNTQGLPLDNNGARLPDGVRFLITSGTTTSTGLEVNDKEKLLTEGFLLQPNGRTIGIESPASQLNN